MSEEYSVGYSEGYQAGWNLIMSAAPQQRKPLTSQKVLNLKDAFYAGFDAYDTPAAPYSDVDEKWSEYKAAHGITAAPEKGN